MIPKKINAKPVIIDFDPGIDDAMALLLALGSPYLNIIATTYFEKINKEKLYQSIKKSVIVLEKHILSKK